MARESSVSLVGITRGESTESVHRRWVAVVDGTGAVVASASEPGADAFIRSAVQPLAAAVAARPLFAVR